jgi:hypothetical protein
MQEQQVEPLDAELTGALVERVQRGVVAVVADPDLRLDEQVAAGDAGATDAFTDLPLVEVRGGGVDEPVAGPEGGLDGPRGLGRGALEDAQAQGLGSWSAASATGGCPCAAASSPITAS